MKTGTTTHYVLCRNRNKPDAGCRKLPRCKVCNRVLSFNWHTGLCFNCGQQAKAEAAAKADPKTRRCERCGCVLQGVFADKVCVSCSSTVNVIGGGK